MFPSFHSNIGRKSPDNLGEFNSAPEVPNIARDVALNQFFRVDQNENAAFWEMYLVSWNTGVMDRNFEKFFRYARNAQGLDYYYEDIQQASNDPKIGEKIEQAVQTASLQITNHVKESMIAARIENNVPLLLVELSWSTDVIGVRLSGDRSHTETFKAAFSDLLPDTVNEIFEVMDTQWDANAWGIAGAITEVAQKFSADRQYQFEKYAGELVKSLAA